MKAIEVWDLRDNVFMSLEEILTSLPDLALRSSWTVSDYITPQMREEFFEVASDGQDRISLLANTDRRVSGEELQLIARTSPQVVWATFRGHDAADASIPWITLHAIDSTFWRCETADIVSRQALLRAFKDVRLKP